MEIAGLYKIYNLKCCPGPKHKREGGGTGTGAVQLSAKKKNKKKDNFTLAQTVRRCPCVGRLLLPPSKVSTKFRQIAGRQKSLHITFFGLSIFQIIYIIILLSYLHSQPPTLIIEV